MDFDTFFVPYIGVVLYIVFGEFFRFSVRKKERDKILNDELLHKVINNQISYIENDKKLRDSYRWTDLILMNSKNARSFVTFDNDIEVFCKASDKYDRLFKDIKESRESINISYYIIRKDFYGKQLLDIFGKNMCQMQH